MQDNIHQYQRKHNIEIHGIPEKEDEDLKLIMEEVVKEVGIHDID